MRGEEPPPDGNSDRRATPRGRVQSGRPRPRTAPGLSGHQRGRPKGPSGGRARPRTRRGALTQGRWARPSHPCGDVAARFGPSPDLDPTEAHPEQRSAEQGGGDRPHLHDAFHPGTFSPDSDSGFQPERSGILDIGADLEPNTSHEPTKGHVHTKPACFTKDKGTHQKFT